MKLAESLGVLPSGSIAPLSVEQVARACYYAATSETEKQRIAVLEERLDLYHDRGRRLFEADVNEAFQDDKLRSEHKKFIKFAEFNNITRRIVDEVSTVYQDAAFREVDEDGREPQKRYLELLRHPSVAIDSVMREANRITNLCNESLVWGMARRNPMDVVASGTPALRVFNPTRFHVVASPIDAVHLIAIVLPIKRSAKNVDVMEPHFEVWSEDEMFQLNGQGQFIRESYVEHRLGRIPGVLVHKRMPQDRLLDADSGKDLPSAHRAITLMNLMMLREQKAGTVVPYVAGDIGNTPMQQSMSRDNLTQFQEGIAPGVLDLKSDPAAFIAAARAVIKQVAANWGIAESVIDLSYQATSGFEITMKRLALREKRHEQMMYPWAPAERQLADVMQVVSDEYLDPKYRFQIAQWNLNFGEIETPQDPTAELELLLKMRTAGLISTADIIIRYNPELAGNREAANRLMLSNIMEETERVEMMRKLQAENANMATSAEDETPEENGERGRQAAQSRSGPPPRTTVQ